MPFAGVPNAKCCGKIRDPQRLLLTSVKHFFIDCILPDEEEWADWPIRFRDRNENPFLDMGAPLLSIFVRPRPSSNGTTSDSLTPSSDPHNSNGCASC